MKTYDAIIIGFGKGGKTIAGTLAEQGNRVALIEKSSKMYGGTCINVGCIPTKSLVHSAKIAENFKFQNFEEKKAFYKKAVEEKRRVVEMLRQKNYNKLFNAPNVTIYQGEASFISEHEVKITGETGEEVITGDKLFINTGSEAFIPPIPGLKESENVYTSETLLELTELPEHLIILGGGYIGLEFASFYSSFGSKVTVVQMKELFIAREDRQIADSIQEAMEKKGVSFLFGAGTTGVSSEGGKVQLVYTVANQEKLIEGDALLVATGRKPNTKNLNLSAAGVETLPNGAVRTDEHRQTSQPHIWAMGDVCGAQQFTYVSLDDYRVVMASLSGGSYTAAERNIPYSVFIDPPFSRVGLKEAEAVDQGYKNIKTAVLPAAAIPKAQVLQQTAGLLKAVIDGDTDQILGVSLFCEESHELINLIKLAMDHQIPYTAIRDQIFTHPIMGESLNDLFAAI